MPEVMSSVAISSVDPTNNLPLPLRLLRSEIVPPAPTRSLSSFDWLPDFAGHPWLAYGASTLLVISHLPSPHQGEESLAERVFRQVLEVSGDVSCPVTAVSWSPVTPSIGELAVGWGNSVCLLSHDPNELNGSFCWSQNAILMQATEVEAIEWTGSGDGMIVGGSEIILWKRRNRSWEVAWKFKANHLQDLVSSTWSIDGLFATATCWSKLQSDCDEAGKCVLVHHSDGKAYRKVELRHPKRISKIQWRPETDSVKNSTRKVLLTCCLDGAVRLWSEVDDGRTKKGGKNGFDHKTSFCVAAVIEINQVLGGNLGRDLYMIWGTQTEGIFKTVKGTNQLISMDHHEHEKVGKCEWLVGYGPGHLVTLWAVHCLDDISPMRLPRVTLWMRHELQKIGLEPLALPDAAGCPHQLSLDKVIVSRSHLYGPPLISSLIDLSPRNTLFWSSLYTRNSYDIEDSSPDQSSLSKFMALKVLDLDGHSGRILQVAFHPISETEVVASLDVNGLVIIWSSSANSHCVLDHPISASSWKLCGRLPNKNNLKYTSICWAPSTLKNERVLLVGHVEGIDCFSVRICGKGCDEFPSHYLCTVPFANNSPLENGPTSIFVIPSPKHCGDKLKSNSFMLLGVWLQEQHIDALSWTVTFHHSDSPGSSHGSTSSGNWMFKATIAGETHCIAVSSSSSVIPEPHCSDKVTSFDVVCPRWLALEKDVDCDYPSYTIATGQADGSIKLWRSSTQDSIPSIPWELVGMLTVGQSPVTAISLSNYGHKIAAQCADDLSKSVHAISIWEIVHFIDSGVFILEDKLYVDAEVVALKWTAVGNDKLFLGVCTEKEMRVYVEQSCRDTILAVSENSSEAQIWQCIAVSQTYSAVLDFVWGPKVMAVLIHANYFSLHREWLSPIDEEHNIDNHPDTFTANLYGDDGMASAMLSHSGVSDDFDPISLPLVSSSSSNYILNMLEMVEKLQCSLPLYHPQALLATIYSGNWKRARAALRHLIENITSSDSSGRGCVPLSNYYEGCVSNSSIVNDFHWHGTTNSMIQSSQFQTGFFSAFNTESNTSINGQGSCSTDGEFNKLDEALKTVSDVSSIEKIQIHAIADLLSEICNPHSTNAYASLDEAGRRFWVSFRYKQLYYTRSFSKTASMKELGVDSSMIGWAFHSDCQENLFDAVLSNESSWQDMRSLGVGFWYTNVALLRSRMEKLARQQYLKNKNPRDCALLYIALNRIQVLAGLFKISKDEKDKPLVGFLLRNFQEEQNKAAALKNAYVLMGKHQLELAIAFFLLGGDTSSAINVCVKNLCDEQLALVLCRLVQGQGGPLELNLITKYILPSTLQRGDLWLASLLEWELEQYHRSFLAMVGCLENSVTKSSTISSSHMSFLNPSIGLYCQMLANKNSTKNAIGEGKATILSRWATLITVTAFSRCGLPLEALEYLSSSASSHGDTHEAGIHCNGHLSAPYGILFGNVIGASSNWVSSSIASTMDTNARLGLAFQFLSKLLQDHLGWPVSTIGPCGETAVSLNSDNVWYEKAAGFQHKLRTTLEQFHHRFSLSSSCLVSMMVSSLCNRGFLPVGYILLQKYRESVPSADESETIDRHLPLTVLCTSVLERTEDISRLLSHIIAACSIASLPSVTCYNHTEVPHGTESKGSDALRLYMHGILKSFSSWRASISLCLGSSDGNLVTRLAGFLDLVEYCSKLAVAWVLGDMECLLQMVQPIMMTCFDGHAPYDVDMDSLKKVYHQDVAVDALDISDVGVVSAVSEINEDKQIEHPFHSIPGDERQLVIQACFWKHISNFVKHKLVPILPTELDSDVLNGYDAQTSLDSSGELGEKIISVLGKTLITAVAYLSSYHVKQLAMFLKKKTEKRIKVPTLIWLKEYRESQTKSISRATTDLDIVNTNNAQAELCLKFWNLCVDPCLVHEAFVLENLDYMGWLKPKPLREWSDIWHELVGEKELDEAHSKKSQNRNEDRSVSSDVSPKGLRKDSETITEKSALRNPEEIYKRNGELIEALCLNSINHRQAAIASNRKGILFFSWEDGGFHNDQSNYIWSDADWPHNGWANSESTRVPTCVSLGVGLGNKKGAHLGLGGATVGVVPLSKTRRPLASNGAQEANACSAVSGLGWETQEDFEQFVDDAPTVETVNTRAFSSHPTLPLFLAGSINTHIYLWEFGKDRATATYGVMPAANVPPPYALASISAVEFGPCGHRFASAALDGTVCTWQLEVGGKSNIRPLESSLCFNGHASDVKYLSSSGSIVAASGHCSNGVNVVVWDTLAPRTTSQASIACHEGGACSVSVFDNDIGSGSISPMIVTGGKNGDVGLHDFRYIATGKTKRHRNSDSREAKSEKSSSDYSDQNSHGMLWYIPKAHLGSVTKTSTIPNTSLFLTGSKDGDVKLWDAKAAKLIHHWPKLHERHTFLQSSSWGYGGIIRAGITDIQVCRDGFLTCGGDGTVKFIGCSLV